MRPNGSSPSPTMARGSLKSPFHESLRSSTAYPDRRPGGWDSGCRLFAGSSRRTTGAWLPEIAPGEARSLPSVCRWSEEITQKRSLPMSKPVVLVIDDEVQIRRLLQLALESAGFKVLKAETGEE